MTELYSKCSILLFMSSVVGIFPLVFNSAWAHADVTGVMEEILEAEVESEDKAKKEVQAKKEKASINLFPREVEDDVTSRTGTFRLSVHYQEPYVLVIVIFLQQFTMVVTFLCLL